MTNPAGYVTAETYDGLGRLTAVWLPGHTKGAPRPTRRSATRSAPPRPRVVATNTLNDTGAYTTAETLYDSLGRQAETQTATPDGGRDITDIYYNSDGLQSLVSELYYTTGAPTASWWPRRTARSPRRPGTSTTATDGWSGRSPTRWRTRPGRPTPPTAATRPPFLQKPRLRQPTGGTPQTTFTDGRGLTSDDLPVPRRRHRQPSDPAPDYDETAYTYTPAQQLATITDAAGNKWSYSYDLAGDQTSQSDPTPAPRPAPTTRPGNC